MIHMSKLTALETGMVGSKTAIKVNNTPAGRRNKAGRRNVTSTGANTRRLNFEAVFMTILLDGTGNNGDPWVGVLPAAEWSLRF